MANWNDFDRRKVKLSETFQDRVTSQFAKAHTSTAAEQ